MKQKATFAAGCFWGVEDAFMHADGVSETRVGYTGGTTEHPTYGQVCAGDTGHKEAVEVTYDPEKISYDTLLEIFWRIHDPTTPGRQGADVGEQYGSAIFCHTDDQRAAAESSLKARNESGEYAAPIVTDITEAAVFYPAEEHHQQYLRKQRQT